MLILRMPNGTLEFSIYRKATHTQNYLKFNSNHSKNHKEAVAISLVDRAYNICSTNRLENEL